MESFLDATLLTTTTYGTWLPGDARGYVQRGQILPPNPSLEAGAKTLLKAEPVKLSFEDRAAAFEGLLKACEEFDYRLSDAVIEATHLHAIVTHQDAVGTMVGRLKNRMRQAVGRGRIWTKGYCARSLSKQEEAETARAYLARHDGVFLLDGRRISAPGSAGGSNND